MCWVSAKLTHTNLATSMMGVDSPGVFGSSSGRLTPGVEPTEMLVEICIDEGKIQRPANDQKALLFILCEGIERVDTEH